MPYKPRILVVESDAAQAQLVESALKIAGADPRCVTHPGEAEALIENMKFDGAVLDWNSTGMDSGDLTRRIRSSKSNSKIPIAMLAAGSAPHAVKAGFALGVNFYLSKPFGAKEIQRLLNASRGSMLAERRRYQRVAINLPVVCEWGQKQQRHRVSGKTINISSSGLLMLLDPQPQVDAQVMLEILVPALRRTFAPTALVRRAGPGQQVAFEFVNFPPDEKDPLMDFLSRNLTVSIDNSPLISGK